MADAGVGETEAAKGASEAKGATEAAAATEAGSAGTAALTAADIAAGAGGLSDAAIAADLAGAELLPSTTAALGSLGEAAAGAGAVGGTAGGAFGTEGGLQTLTVTGTPPAAAGAAGPSLAGFPAALGGIPAGAGFGADPGMALGTGDISGLTTPDAGAPAPTDVPAGPFQMPDAPIGTQATDLTGDDSNFWEWLKQPKNALTATSLGLTARNALFPPGLPGAAKTALGAAGPAVQNASMIIQTGGMGSPLWTAQKASIDSMIDLEIKNQSAALQQAMASSGMGDKNSGIVQEQIASLTQNLNVQREALYRQALEQNVQNAVAELSGADATLMAIAQMQLNQSNEAMQLALSGAGLAARLQQLQGP